MHMKGAMIRMGLFDDILRTEGEIEIFEGAATGNLGEAIRGAEEVAIANSLGGRRQRGGVLGGGSLASDLVGLEIAEELFQGDRNDRDDDGYGDDRRDDRGDDGFDGDFGGY